MQARVRRLIASCPDEAHCKRFTKRLLREITHLFTFIRLGTECTNNISERAIRPSVVARNISLGSKTYAGAYKHAVLFTIRETCRMRGVNPYDFLVRYMRNEIDDIPQAKDVSATT